MTSNRIKTAFTLAALAIAGFAFNALSGLGFAQTPASAFNKDPWPAPKDGPVKVFILAGQSNMQGNASLRTLEYLIYNRETAAKYQHWKDRTGAWVERSDVWITTTDGDRHGKLKPGYGANEWKLGPELGIGWAMGEHFGEQVLLIKTCWGGRSVRKDFLPPSAAMPSDEALRQELENLKKKKPDTTLEEVKASYGKAYRDTIATTKDVLGRMNELFPGTDPKRGYELAGFVFFQGWNDLVDGEQRAEKYASYSKRLPLLIKDLRKDLGVPNLPVVIGGMGAKEEGDFQAAQKAATELPEFKGNVTYVDTRRFWDPELEALVNQGVWKGPDWVKFYNVGSDKGYHYLGSAKILYSIGEAFGEGMTGMLKQSQPAGK